MKKNIQNIHPDQWLKDLPAPTETEVFKSEEMVTCPKCERKSPPPRLNCFYCGADLPISEAQSKLIKPIGRQIEAWEKGFNVIYTPYAPVAETANLAELAKYLSIEQQGLREFLTAHKSLPMARVESEKEAQILVSRLADFGFKSLIISDESLQIETFTRRLRGIEFWDDKLILIRFNVDEIVEISAEDITLIVTGALFERRIESTESLKRKKENKVVDTSEVSNDKALIDIYTKTDPVGYRIELAGFDFSCLESEKSLLAKDNMQSLIGKLRSVAPQAAFDDDYVRIRAEIGKVWEVEQHIDAGSINRQSIGSFKRKNTIIINNLSQFTRYSRLQWQLL